MTFRDDLITLLLNGGAASAEIANRTVNNALAEAVGHAGGTYRNCAVCGAHHLAGLPCDVCASRARTAGETGEKSTATSGDATPDLTVYRAEHDSGMPLCTYTNLNAAQQHCESYVRREHPSGESLVFDWIPDDEEDTAVWELVAQLGANESTTGYCVAVVNVASAYDEEADE